jgi:enterochelin esterase family protein
MRSKAMFFAPLALTGLLFRLALGQDGPPAAPPKFSSLEVKEDRSVVVRVWAPKAESVRLVSSDIPNANPFGLIQDLDKDEKGIWHGVVGPVPPGTYRYQFNIDGVSIVDPQATETSQTNSNTWSLCTIPGSSPSEFKNVPHGAVAVRTYDSKALSRQRRAHVYTPPGYEKGNDAFPVLYLLHGAMDCDGSWSTIGRAGLVMDNLLAAGKVSPMVIVMPMGHTGAFTFGPDGGNFQKQMAEFEEDFVNDLKPFIEANYRLKQGREYRAIAGLSMGGAQTLNIAFGNLSEYSHIGVFSSGVFGIEGGGGPAGNSGTSWETAHATTLQDPSLKKGLKLVWFATGNEDFLLKTSQATAKMLEANDFDVTYEETEGGHTWINWREHYLPAFLQLIFQP